MDAIQRVAASITVVWQFNDEAGHFSIHWTETFLLGDGIIALEKVTVKAMQMAIFQMSLISSKFIYKRSSCLSMHYLSFCFPPPGQSTYLQAN
eukprot:scaffold155735_cov23-Prasinocladus_malaysianus.AAC.1